MGWDVGMWMQERSASKWVVQKQQAQRRCQTIIPSYSLCLALLLAFIMKDRVVQTCAHKSQHQMKSQFIDLLMNAKHKNPTSIIQQSNYWLWWTNLPGVLFDELPICTWPVMTSNWGLSVSGVLCNAFWEKNVHNNSRNGLLDTICESRYKKVITNVFTLVFLMCIWRSCRYRSHSNGKL